MKPKVDIYLTVRLKSSRLPKKAIAVVENQTIIEHIIDRAKHLKNANQIILCTSDHEDDQILTEIATQKGIPFVAGDQINIIKRFLKAADTFGSDIGVRITGDNCLFSVDFVDYSIEQHILNGVDYTTTKDLAGGSKGDVFSINALRQLSSMLQDDRASEYLSWLLQREDLFKVLWLESESKLKRPQYRLHCDTTDDLEFIKRIYSQFYVKGEIINYNDVIKFLDEHPEIVAINAQIKQISQQMVESEIDFTLKK
jgi:spore coat polysaccharide biosynthesis protein SpsF (cytidylyltransferase family)